MEIIDSILSNLKYPEYEYLGELYLQKSNNYRKYYYLFVMKLLEFKVDKLKCFDQPLINEIFSSYKCLISHPQVINTKKFIGGTDYIDRVRLDDMKGNIMWGIDVWKRPFISISGHSDKSKPRDFVFTIFQRYTDSIFNWQYGTCFHDVLYCLGSLTSKYNDSKRNMIRSMIEGRDYLFEIYDENVIKNTPVYHYNNI